MKVTKLYIANGPDVSPRAWGRYGGAATGETLVLPFEPVGAEQYVRFYRYRVSSRTTKTGRRMLDFLSEVYWIDGRWIQSQNITQDAHKTPLLKSPPRVPA